MLTSTQKAKIDNVSPFEGLDKMVNQKRGVVKGVYDFATLGGATGTYLLKDENGDVIQLPSKAIITQAYIDIITACVSTGNNGTIAVQANAANDLLSAVDADTLSGVSAGVPVGTAATMVKLTAARNISLLIGTNPLTAGKFNFFVEWVLSD
jgi:hypothetical protein